MKPWAAGWDTIPKSAFCPVTILVLPQGQEWEVSSRLNGALCLPNHLSLKLKKDGLFHTGCLGQVTLGLCQSSLLWRWACLWGECLG